LQYNKGKIPSVYLLESATVIMSEIKPIKKPITQHTLKRLKEAGTPFACLTAYDFTTAQLLDQAGIEVLLVGDSLAMTVLGHANTLSVTVEEMLHHVKAVTRATKNAWVIADAPFMSYHLSVEQGVANCAKFIQEGHAHAVKIEGCTPEIVALVKRLVAIGIPVVGHLGLTPQAMLSFGGFKLQAKTSETALTLIQQAETLEQAGVCALVLEMIPTEPATVISQRLTVPTIGIGAGNGCDGQVLVIDDLLGRFQGFQTKFVRQYMAEATLIKTAVTAYQTDVKNRSFPNPKTEATPMVPEAYAELLNSLSQLNANSHAE
jgi:3-methyl-2-oxobutanoate hydroxymethyltransferase